METPAKIEVKDLFKIFGPHPKKARQLLEQGLEKDEIFDKTETTIGVQKASFSIREGEVFVIMGLSGSGKSTMVRMLNRLIEPTSGQVLIDGEDLTAMSDSELVAVRRKKMSMVFQSFALMPHMTVLENAAFGLELDGVEKKVREERALKALAQVGLESNANSMPGELSGGMQQRVGLARGLAVDPDILLMDEAFSALDPLIRTEMQDELLKLQAKAKRTIVFISHDLDEAMRIGDRIAIMEGGIVVQVGKPDEILKNPANEYVRSFFRGVDVSSVISVADIASRHQVTIVEREGNVRSARERIAAADRDYGYVIDAGRKYHGVVSASSLEHEMKAADPQLSHAFLPGVTTLSSDRHVGDVIGEVAAAPCPLPVVDAGGRYIGVVSRAILLGALSKETQNG